MPGIPRGMRAAPGPPQRPLSPPEGRVPLRRPAAAPLPHGRAGLGALGLRGAAAEPPRGAGPVRRSLRRSLRRSAGPPPPSPSSPGRRLSSPVPRRCPPRGIPGSFVPRSLPEPSAARPPPRLGRGPGPLPQVSEGRPRARAAVSRPRAAVGLREGSAGLPRAGAARSAPMDCAGRKTKRKNKQTEPRATAPTSVRLREAAPGRKAAAGTVRCGCSPAPGPGAACWGCAPPAAGGAEAAPGRAGRVEVRGKGRGAGPEQAARARAPPPRGTPRLPCFG